MGQRASDTRGITFEDVVVPAEVESRSFKIYSWNTFSSPYDDDSISTVSVVKSNKEKGSKTKL